MAGASKGPDHRVRIAVIDDDVSFREALAGLVESLGYAVSAFESAEAFLTSRMAAAHACLIVDVRMPGMGGLELQAALAASGGPAPVIFVTSAPDPGIVGRALEAGALGVLAKPFDREDLTRLIGLALERRRRQDAGP